MKTINQQLFDTEVEIQNMTMFIGPCLEKLHAKIVEYYKLQKELYAEDGIDKLNTYANQGSE